MTRDVNLYSNLFHLHRAKGGDGRCAIARAKAYQKISRPCYGGPPLSKRSTTPYRHRLLSWKWAWSVPRCVTQDGDEFHPADGFYREWKELCFYRERKFVASLHPSLKRTSTLLRGKFDRLSDRTIVKFQKYILILWSNFDRS